MVEDLGKVLALELMTAAQALDLRRDMINAARDLADRAEAAGLAAKVQGGPLPGTPGYEAFLAEVETLRVELSAAEPFHPGIAVAAAHAAIRERVPFLDRDRALDIDLAAMLAVVREGAVLAAVRQAR
jgi:histidine ammonia-lyase